MTLTNLVVEESCSGGEANETRMVVIISKAMGPNPIQVYKKLIIKMDHIVFYVLGKQLLCRYFICETDEAIE